MKKVGALARITFLEGIRNRAVYGIALFALFVLGLNIAVAGFFMRDVGKVTVDMNLSALTVAGLLLVLFVGLNLISKDIDRKTIQLVLSKPISRGEYIWGKYLGIQLFVLVAMSVLLLFSCATIALLLGLYPKYFHGFSWGTFMLAYGFIFLQVSVVSAIIIFFSSITTSSFVTLIFSVCAYVVGVTIEEVLFYLRTGTASQDLTISEPLLDVIQAASYITPNLSVFDLKLEAAHGLAVGMDRLAISMGYGITYIFVLLLAASMIFKRREFH